MTHPTKFKPIVRQNRALRVWEVTCSCGYLWHTRYWHRAITYAIHHSHTRAA